MLDFEVFSGAVGASSYADWANQWCQTIVNDVAASSAFVKPAIYISACHAELDSSVAQWNNDIADYNGESSQTGTPWSVCSDDNVWGGALAPISGNIMIPHPFQVFLANNPMWTCSTAPRPLWLRLTSSAVLITRSIPGALQRCYRPGPNPYTGSMTGTWESSICGARRKPDPRPRRSGGRRRQSGLLLASTPAYRHSCGFWR